jgi:hypothetical protein
MPSNLQVQQYGRTARTPRRPQHTFAVELRPWQLVPYFIAPVLPGETMKNLLMQARVVSDPVLNPLTGWWCEFYVWYIKHRDLNSRDNLTRMMIDPAYQLPPSAGTSNTQQYYAVGAYDFVNDCQTRIVETYFRDTGEAAGVATISPYYSAQVTQRTALDSALLDSAYSAGTADDIVIGADDTVSGQELSKSWILWNQYRASNITHLSYEEYLNTYGIPIPAGQEGTHRPELVRYVKEWSYPTNTIDPVTGAPTSALSWAVAERADKDRFFREPGFLFGMACVRPKCYLTGQKGTVSGFLMDALAWLPAVMGDNPEYSVRLFANAAGPFPGVTAPYRIDLKDLFLYGEQYTNMATYPNPVGLPAPTLGKKYPLAADADAMFKTPTANKIRMDGVVSLNILGMQVDTSPTSAPGTF